MIFNDYDTKYKNPPGAVRAGERVRFSITPPAECGGAALTVWEDGQQSPSCFPMEKTGDGYVLEHDFGAEGIYFYAFSFSDGSAVNRSSSETTTFEQGGAAFQQTVFDASYQPAADFAGGVIYQIFPDRFNIGGGVIDSGFKDRVIHKNTGEMPVFRPDEAGRVRNNDYFGGNLPGIEQKLPYLTALGVTCIYLNPICESHSNHRYDTACYRRLDPMLGTEADFARLCKKAHEAGIRIVLDGVFSHTGDDSEYFNRYSRYDTLGAYQSRESEYYSWFKFQRWPNEYTSWWGFETLPEINEDDENFARYICGEGGAIDYWMSLGAYGFRLDVADELPDSFIEQIRTAVKRHGDDKILIGEVWEDASNKISYGTRRRFLYGRELDSVMNYPFRNATLDFVRCPDAELFAARICEIVKNYPKPMMDVMMNMLSTHDTARAINELVVGSGEGTDREQQSRVVIENGEYMRGVEMLKLATVLQFTLPGIPCIYYGDEIGMQGMRDPFNRGFMRWNAQDENLLEFVKEISKMRKKHTAFADGDFVPLYAQDAALAFLRRNADEIVLVAVNRAEAPRDITLPDGENITVEPWRHVIKKLG